MRLLVSFSVRASAVNVTMNNGSNYGKGKGAETRRSYSLGYLRVTQMS